MNFLCETADLNDYLAASEEVDYNDPAIVELTARLKGGAVDQIDLIRQAFEYVRDEIHHSWDIQSDRITCAASEVLRYREGICYAKSNLLCAILRGAGIPAGFCYQRITLGDTPDTGYCIHALNAAYLSDQAQWIRLDARGNKPGIQAEFSLQEEKLAFPIRLQYDELDYDTIYAIPHPKTIETLRAHTSCMVMYQNGLPQDL